MIRARASIRLFCVDLSETMVHPLPPKFINERSARGDRDWLLFRGVRSILRCDQAEVVHGIARYVISQHASLQFLAALIERTRNGPIPGIIALIGWLRSFLSVRDRDRRDGAVWIARLNNERRALEAFPQLTPALAWTELKFRSWPDAAALAALGRKLGPRRIFRIARRLHRRYEFFKALRCVELIGYYARYDEIFGKADFSLAVMSSHSNPHGIAFNLAARKHGVPVVLITHGMPVRPVARLYYDLAMVHCEAARQTYLEEGCEMNRVMVHGRRQHHAPMPAGRLPERLRMGIFLCKDVNEERLQAMIGCLVDHARVSHILIRPHPKNLWRGLDEWIASLNNPRVKRSAGSSVLSDLEAADIVLAGNSSVLIDAVTAGRPAGYVPGLDHGSPDLHAFVARGLIYPFADEPGSDYWDRFDPEAMLGFYQQQEWASVLRFFANVDEDATALETRLAAAMRDLAKSNLVAGGEKSKQQPRQFQTSTTSVV